MPRTDLWWQWPCTDARVRRDVAAASRIARRESRRAGSTFSLQPLRVLVVREQVEQLVAEDRDAARLEPDDRRAGFDLGPQRVEDLAQQRFRAVEHAVVVERPAAAELPRGTTTSEAGVLEHLDGGLRRAGVKVVVEGVGPEDDALRRPRSRAADDRAGTKP